MYIIIVRKIFLFSEVFGIFLIESQTKFPQIYGHLFYTPQYRIYYGRNPVYYPRNLCLYGSSSIKEVT